MIPHYHVGRGPLLWRIWWHFVWGPILRVIRVLPIAEWRREQWSWRIDCWAMDHIGRVGRKP